MDGKEYTRIVGSRSRSYTTNIPKEIAEKLGISEGSNITFKILGDVITIHKTNPEVQIDVVTKDVFALTSKIRILRKKELDLNADFITNQIDSNGKPNIVSREKKLNDIRMTMVQLHREFDEIRKNIKETFGDLESFSVSELTGLNDLLLLRKQLGGNDAKSDYDISVDFINELVNTKRKYQELIKKTELLLSEQKIPSHIASEIKSVFNEEVCECNLVLEKIVNLARST